MLDSDERARALARIGYFDNTTKQGRQVDYRRLLAWFVAFAQTPLASKNPAELRGLREEMRALQEEAFKFFEDDTGTANQLAKTQRTVAEYLNQLVRTGEIKFEEFQLRPSILLPRFRPRLPAPSPFKHTIYIDESVEPYHGKGLLYLFFLALKSAGDRLRPCLHCSTLFVQARRKQRFCKRTCQQVASMRELRDRRRKAKATKHRRRRSPHRTAKGAKTHGKKK